MLSAKLPIERIALDPATLFPTRPANRYRAYFLGLRHPWLAAGILTGGCFTPISRQFHFVTSGKGGLP
jgi:hypothetical protein